VMKNSFWGLTGGWITGISFSILSASAQSRSWIESMYADFPKERDELKGHFPILKDALPQLTALENVETAFALLSFNAFKGYMTMCSLRYFSTNGKELCSLCDNPTGPNKVMCSYWLPTFEDSLAKKARASINAVFR